METKIGIKSAYYATTAVYNEIFRIKRFPAVYLIGGFIS